MSWYSELLGIWKSVTGSTDKVDVSVQSNTNKPFIYLLVNEIKTDISLTSDVTPNSSIVNVSSGHGFVAEDILTIWNENKYFEQRVVKSVTTDAITLEAPLSYSHLTTECFIVRGNAHLSVDGTIGSPVRFTCKPRYIDPIDIGCFRIVMEHTSAGDLSTFGGIAELPNGLFAKQVGNPDVFLGNYRKNIDFYLNGAEISFPTKVGGGNPGTLVTFDINKPERFDSVRRILLSENGEIYADVRDTLSTLLDLQVIVIGSFTEGE